jgi:hypothetical protein
MRPISWNFFAAICLSAAMPLYSPAPASATKDVAVKVRQSDAEAAHDAEAALRAADRHIGEQDWPAANQKLKQGIDLIRVRSLLWQPGVIDDSEFALHRANRKERDGDLQTAAELRRQYLAHQLKIFREKIAE